jgi:hypothetical protein
MLVAPQDHDVGAHDRSMMTRAQRVVVGPNGEETTAVRRKGKTRHADAKAKMTGVFHFQVCASPSPGLLPFVWAIGLLYLQLTYMGLGPLTSRAGASAYAGKRAEPMSFSEGERKFRAF